MNQAEKFLLTSESVRAEVQSRLHKLIPESPKSLYDPIRFILGSPGKYLRPVLTYLVSLSDPKADWLPAGCAVELLHNFTLVHDDIMDNAASRRGKPTLHKKYDMNTAILAGDAIIALAEGSLSSGKYQFANEMIHEFSHGFRSVCEGQAFDKEFELRNDVTTEDYIHMIDLKSAKMLELAAVLGAYSAGGKNVEDVRLFAHHTGIAFQIRDDLLDLTANEETFGKTTGGDILEGKRSYLYVTAMQSFDTLQGSEKSLLLRIQEKKATTNDIEHAKKLFTSLGVIEKANDAIKEQTMIAQHSLQNIPDPNVREGLLQFAEYLLGRSY